ncbi:hypothetical protein OE88DRAFT_1656307 [Heliocybe sulcata]|uniref:Fungal-type protein kinase domain-containing protein n=1 Tax=Heliocybe sulcata TaxID=5364 RepID=A0A5C3N6C9_9AGAM|nr:hypothetical protein OE88DRAFT_1656307 [Heliocybe sulcata]
MKSPSLAPSEIAASVPPDTPPLSPVLLNDDVVSNASHGPSHPTTPDPVVTAPDATSANPPTTPPDKSPPAHEWNTPYSNLNERPSVAWQHASQSGETGTRRREVGHETTRKTLATVAIDDFFTLCFPLQQDEGVISDAYENAPAQAKQDVSTLLDAVPTGEGVEKEMYKPLMKAIATIFETLWPAQCALHLKDTSSDRGGSPDLTFFANNTNNKTDKWEQGLAFIEVKPQDRQDPFYDDERSPREELHMYFRQMQVWNQIQDYATRAYGARSRCFMVAIGIFGQYARFFRWDRSLVTVSRGFNYKEEPELLWQFIAALGAPGYDGSGLDPTVADYVEVQRLAVPGLEEKYAKARAKRLLSLEASELSDAELRKQSSVITVPSSSDGKEEKYISVGPPLFVSGTILGRGTRAWLAVPVPGTVENPARSNEDHFVIIKDSWRDESRAPEGDVYRAIYGNADSVFGIARIRSSVDLYNAEGNPVERDFMHTTIAAWVLRYFNRRFCRRVHHRCVLDSVGINLGRFETTRELMEAIRDAVIGHRSMSEKDILHRDISAYNVMISAYPSCEGNARGFLIDMDYATVLGKAGSEDELREITGTTAFLSIARDPDRPDTGPHRIWHDLESFFWVALYIVVRHANMGGTVTVEKVISLFDKGQTEFRRGFIATTIQRIRVNGHPALGKCLQRLAELVASHYSAEELPPQLREEACERLPDVYRLLRDHQPFIDTIDAALGSHEWPEPDFEAKPFTIAHAETRKRMEDAIKLMEESVRSTRDGQTKRKREVELDAESDGTAATKRVRQEDEGTQVKEKEPRSVFACVPKDVIKRRAASKERPPAA